MASITNQGAGSYISLLVANTVLASMMPMLIILGGLAGLMLAATPALATLPASLQALAGLLAATPISLLMGRKGRRVGFLSGATIGVLGGIIGALAIKTESFALLCLAHMILGVALASFQFFRFAAAEIVPVQWRPIAISLMMTSGLIAAFVGPQIFIWARNLTSEMPLVGAYAALSLIGTIGMLPLWGIREVGRQKAMTRRLTTASLAVLKQPRVIQAVVAAATSQGVMMLLMAPTTIAMTGCGFSSAVSADVIRWHVVAMFAPSLLTGMLIRRFGAKFIVAVGLLLLGSAAITATQGMTGSHFYTSLIILGIGWNFGFIGATNLLADAVSPESRAIAQGANDTIIALVSAVSAFASGALVTGPGWTILAQVALPIVAIGAAALWVLNRNRHSAKDTNYDACSIVTVIAAPAVTDEVSIRKE